MKQALVRYEDQTAETPCPHGNVRRIVTGGDGGVANVHVVRVSGGGRHWHQAYDETYYVLAGTGSIVLGDETHPLRPGAVVVIPAGLPHQIGADEGQVLEFVIFGTPATPISSEAARPRS
jgi:mannose-6-phosphate isomerase-like protein (cupin superfamily)